VRNQSASQLGPAGRGMSFLPLTDAFLNAREPATIEI
jgi:hypothetical protein